MPTANFLIWRGDQEAGGFLPYRFEVSPGMVVLDAILRIQAEQAPDLAVRWNCKAGRCGSCSAEINGRPALMCMTRLSALRLERPVTIEPMRAFPIVKDLVADVSWNYEVMKGIRKFAPRSPSTTDGSYRMSQKDVDRVQEFRKCIECFLCQDVCHVLREHRLHASFAGPRSFVHVAALEMHPLDTQNRAGDLKDVHGIGYCNITGCCRDVCPEGIVITENAIIPLKERVADEYYDPLRKLFRILRTASAGR